jgi:hypothetical protein
VRPSCPFQFYHRSIVTKLEELAAYADSGAELNARYELETYVTEQRAKELMTKFHMAMKSEPPTTSKVKKLDFDAIVHPKRKRPPR